MSGLARPPLLLLAVVGALVVAPATVRGHDLLLESGHEHLDARIEVSLRLLMGHPDGAKLIQPSQKATASYVCITPDGKRHVPGQVGAGLGIYDAKASGLYLFAFASKPTLRAAADADLRLVLADAGWTKKQVAGVRARTVRPWRVEEVHHAKSVVVLGAGAAGDVGATTGLDVEFFLEQRPDALRVGASVDLRLHRGGRPVAGARVVAYPRTATTREIVRTTDAKGRASFPISQAGGWALRTVAIERAPREDAAEWRVRRATLTFEVPDRKAPAKPTQPATGTSADDAVDRRKARNADAGK